MTKPITFDGLPTIISKSNIIRLHQDAGDRVREWQKRTNMHASDLVSHVVMSVEVSFGNERSVLVSEDAYAALTQREQETGKPASDILSEIIVDALNAPTKEVE